MKLSLAVQTPETPTRSAISLLSGSFAEIAEKAAAWGADGLELMPVNPSVLNPAEIQRPIYANHLEICAVGTALFSILDGLNLLTPDTDKANLAYQRLLQTIELAAALRAPLVTLGGFRGRFSAIPDGRQRLIELLRNAAKVAAAHNVRLALEPINRYQSDGISTVVEGLVFITELNHPSIGLVIDTCHMTMEERSWSEPFRQAMTAGKLWHVHVADSNRLAPGNGLVDFFTVFSTLRELGYSQHVALEILAKPDPDSAARQGLTYLQKILKGLE